MTMIRAKKKIRKMRRLSKYFNVIKFAPTGRKINVGCLSPKVINKIMILEKKENCRKSINHALNAF